MKENDMKNILHPHKHTPSHMDARESKLEATMGDRNLGVSPEQRHQMIAEAAYWRAQKRSSIEGNPENDWYEAEEEISQLLFQSENSHSEPQH